MGRYTYTRLTARAGGWDVSLQSAGRGEPEWQLLLQGLHHHHDPEYLKDPCSAPLTLILGTAATIAKDSIFTRTQKQ